MNEIIKEDVLELVRVFTILENAEETTFMPELSDEIRILREKCFSWISKIRDDLEVLKNE